MTPSPSADISPLVSRTAAREAFRDALRLYVGRGRRWSVKQLSNGTGIADRMIECFIAPIGSTDYRRPDFEEVLTLSKFLGPEFTSEWLCLADQGAFQLPDSEDKPPAVIAADNAEDNAALTRAAVDNQFDRDERPDLRSVGTRMMARGAHLRAVASQ